jgi:large subunit ribosomal protein L22
MSKKARPRALPENEAKAVTRSIRVSPRKLNDVASEIRGMKVDKALAYLTFSRRRIAKDVKKTLESAIANAENNHDLDINALVGRIEKFFSELTIVVREVRAEKEAA